MHSQSTHPRRLHRRSQAHGTIRGHCQQQLKTPENHPEEDQASLRRFLATAIFLHQAGKTNVVPCFPEIHLPENCPKQGFSELTNSSPTFATNEQTWKYCNYALTEDYHKPCFYIPTSVLNSVSVLPSTHHQLGPLEVLPQS